MLLIFLCVTEHSHLTSALPFLLLSRNSTFSHMLEHITQISRRIVSSLWVNLVTVPSKPGFVRAAR